MAADKKDLTPPTWMGRPVAHRDHIQDLETRAAVNEFHAKMPRQVAEQVAHDEYVKDQRADAAAHHLTGMKAAQATGNHEDARKHWALYDLHLKALGKESIGPVPPEVESRLSEGAKSLYRFKAHRGDLYALHAPTEDQAPPQGVTVQKSEASQCKWKLGERRCRRQVTGDYCHSHVDHWANKIKQREAKEQALDKADLPPQAPGPQLHDNLPGFMAGLKALPQGSPARGKYITSHMNHGPFLQAVAAHPQGKALHSQMMGFLNSKANAGPGGPTKTVVKGEVINFPGNKTPAKTLPRKGSVTQMPVKDKEAKEIAEDLFPKGWQDAVEQTIAEGPKELPRLRSVPNLPRKPGK